MKIVSKNPSRVPQYTPVRSILDDMFMTPSLLDDMFSTPFVSSSRSLSADVWEEDDNVMIKMAIPGLKKEDINIEIDNDMVSIKGHHKEEEKEEEDDKKKYYYRSLERSFEQRFNLPSVVDSEQAEAKYEDGILSLKLPKAAEYKRKQIEVK